MFIINYLIAFGVFFGIDIIWLSFIARDLYREQIGFLLNPKPNWIAAMSFYLLFIVGLVIFVIEPAIEANSWQKALLLGALFGLITYATYDLTNLATIKDWPLKVTLIDLLWGTFLGSSVSTITYYIAKSIGL